MHNNRGIHYSKDAWLQQRLWLKPLDNISTEMEIGDA